MFEHPPPKVWVRKGLEDQDDNLDRLQEYFKELQSLTVETSMSADIDLLTFALGSHYFGVIMMETPKKNAQEADSSTAASAPDPTCQLAPMAPLLTEEEILALPEEDRLARWRVAFQAKLEGELDDEDDDFLPTSRHVFPQNSSAYPLAPFHVSQTPVIPSSSSALVPQQIRSSKAVSDSLEDLISWPDDGSDDGGPPSSTGDESSTEDIVSQYENDPFENIGSLLDDSDESYGREYLESTEPGPSVPLPEIPEDPAVKKMIMDSAIRFQAQMQARTIRLYEEKIQKKSLQKSNRIDRNSIQCTSLSSALVTDEQKNKEKPIGLVYLTASQTFSDLLHLGECNIGVYIDPEHRNLNGVVDAVNDVVGEAFQDHDCHRLSAIIVDHKDKLDFLTIFTSVGFRMEGIRRHAYFNPIPAEWKDVTYLAILATEWVLDRGSRSDRRILPNSLWDEVLSRHQREQEEVLRMEERKYGYSLKRTSSMETIRENYSPTPLDGDSGAESSGLATDSSASSRGKRRKLNIPPVVSFSARRSSFSSESGIDSDWEVPGFGEASSSAQRFMSSHRGSGSSNGTSGSFSDVSSLWDDIIDDL